MKRKLAFSNFRRSLLEQFPKLFEEKSENKKVNNFQIYAAIVHVGKIMLTFSHKCDNILVKIMLIKYKSQN